MRMPCAKCGYLHDSTVTPFLHDIVKEDNSFDKEITSNPGMPDLASYGKYKHTNFECGKCGAKNYLMLIWSVVEEEEEASDNIDYGGPDPLPVC